MAASDVLDQAIEDENLTAQPVDEAADAEIPAAEAQDESADVSPGGGESEGADVDSGIEAELLERARAYGIPTEGVSPKDLTRHMATTLDRQIAQLGREAMQWRQSQGQPAPQAPTQPQSPAAKSGLDLEARLREHLPEAEIDPALRKGIHAALNDINQHSEQQIAALKEELSKSYEARVSPIEQRLLREEGQRMDALVDGFFSGLGKEWEGEFGKGSITELLKNPVAGTQVEKRKEIVATANAMRHYFITNGQQSPPDDVLLRRAHNAVYADRQTTIAKKQIAQQLNQRKGAALSRPAAKNGKAIDPKEAALKFSNDWDREHLADL
jgi:hypothetical protein